MNYCIGIDIGGTNTKVGIVSEAGELLEHNAIPTPQTKAMNDVVHAAANYARMLVKKTGVTPNGAGVAAPGMVDLEGEHVLVAPNFPAWKKAPLRRVVSDTLELPVVMGNDVDLFAIGEHRWGAAQGMNNFVAVAVGTGVGGAVFINGSLYRGATGGAGELGFTLLSHDGPAVSGIAGVLEAYIGRNPFDDMVLERFKTGEVPSPKRITELAAQGEPRAREIHDLVAHFMSEAAATWLHILNPEAIVIGGGTLAGAGYFFDQFERNLRARARRPHTEHLKILPSKLGYYAGVMGAAALWVEKKAAP